MVIGIGSDLVDIRRIEKTLSRFGERFLNRIFSEVEREKSESRIDKAASYAKRFAAKEAVSKALGTGFRKGIFWRDISVVNMPEGKPQIVLTGGALSHLTAMVPVGFRPQIDLSLSDDSFLAHAIVIITVVPN